MKACKVFSLHAFIYGLLCRFKEQPLFSGCSLSGAYPEKQMRKKKVRRKKSEEFQILKIEEFRRKNSEVRRILNSENRRIPKKELRSQKNSEFRK
jgi:hypothetical protein